MRRLMKLIISALLILPIMALFMTGCQRGEAIMDTQSSQGNTGMADTQSGQAEIETAAEDYTDYTAGQTMLFHYAEGTVGTEIQMPYSRVRIYTYDDTHLLLEECVEGGMDDERVYGYLIPADSYDKVLEVILENGMDHWDEEEGIAIAGGFYSCIFLIDGEQYRASSDNMPEDGYRAFSAVEKAAYSLDADGELLYERYTDPDYLAKVAADLEGTVRDEEELLSYLKTVDLSQWNYKKYLTVTSGMGPYDEDHNVLGGVNNYVLLLMTPGYYPYTDMQGEYTFTVMRESDDGTKDQGEFNEETYWGFDESNDCFRAHPTVYDDEDIGSIRDVKLNKISGKAAYFDIPKELLHEDDYGEFFYYQGKSTRYYLIGYTGYVGDDGYEYIRRSDIWVRDILYSDD